MKRITCFLGPSEAVLSLRAAKQLAGVDQEFQMLTALEVVMRQLDDLFLLKNLPNAKPSTGKLLLRSVKSFVFLLFAKMELS